MACLYETVVENVAPGNRMLVEDIGWCIKLEPQEGVEFNAMVESTWNPSTRYFEQSKGRLVIVPPGTKVVSGYGWGHR